MEKNARIYVAGHRGMVGSAIVRELRRQGYDNLVLRTHKELDLCDQRAVEAFFEAEMPEYVFLAAAKVPLKKSLNVLPMGICMGVLVAGASYFTRDIAPAGGLSLFGFELSWALSLIPI